MTKLVRSLLITIAVTSVTSFADSLSTRRAFSTEPVSLPLSKNLNFRSSRIEVTSKGWFNSLFELDNCEAAMSSNLVGVLEVRVNGPHQLELFWQGKKSVVLQKSHATYVPVHYRFGEPVPAHTLITIPGFVILHATVTSKDGIRSLRLSLVRRDPARGLKLETILTAYEL
jgi:hypothetical protein